MQKTSTTAAGSPRTLRARFQAEPGGLRALVATVCALSFLSGCSPVSRHQRRVEPVRLVAASTTSVLAAPAGDPRDEILRLARLRDQPGAQLRRAFLLIESDRPSEALTDLNSVIHGSSKPSPEVEALARTLRSEAHLALGDRDRAAWDRSQALKLTADPVLISRLGGGLPRPQVREASTRVMSLASLSIEPRSAWNAKPMRRRGLEALGPVRRITVHHSGTPIRTLKRETSAAQIASFQKTHQRKGWADIGYHYLIDPAGRIWAGRDPTIKGSHAANANSSNLGICLLGNLMPSAQGAPPAEQLRSLDRLLLALCAEHGLSGESIRTHKELKRSTVCPGPYLTAHVERFRRSTGFVTAE